MTPPKALPARRRRDTAADRIGYRDVFEHANDIMVIHDEHSGAIVEANRKACETYGYSVEELRRLKIGDLTRNDTRFNTPEGLRHIHEAVRTRQAVIFEWVILDGRHREIPVEVNLTRIKVGSRHRVLAIARDISERRAAERTLRARERYYRRLIENSTDGIAILDRTGRIAFVGPSIQTMLGVPDRFLKGRSLLPFVHPDDGPAVRTWLDSPPSDGAAITFRIRHADGSWRVHEASGRAMFDDPAVAGLLVNFRDVTERLRAQDQLRRQEQQLAQAARFSAAGEMAAAIAHELNQPLFAIVNFLGGCTRRLKSGDVARDDLLEVLGLAQHEAERAGKIIKALRDFLGKREAQRQLLEPRALLDEVAELIRLKAERQDVRLRYRIEVPAEVRVACDDVLIQQVILNLVANAIEAMEPVATDERMLDIGLDSDGHEVRMSFTDRGPGLPEQQPEQVFDAFWSTKKDGLGIGLSLCRSILDSHGGRLWAEAGPGRPTCFHFTLPAIAGGTDP